jgi:hypothetical protein
VETYLFTGTIRIRWLGAWVAGEGFSLQQKCFFLKWSTTVFLTSNKAYAKTMHLSEKAYAKGGCIIWVNFLGCAHAHLVFLDLGEKVCHPAREVVEFFIRCHALLHPTLAHFSCEKKKKTQRFVGEKVYVSGR